MSIFMMISLVPSLLRFHPLSWHSQHYWHGGPALAASPDRREAAAGEDSGVVGAGQPVPAVPELGQQREAELAGQPGPQSQRPTFAPPHFSSSVAHREGSLA